MSCQFLAISTYTHSYAIVRARDSVNSIFDNVNFCPSVNFCPRAKRFDKVR